MFDSSVERFIDSPSKKKNNVRINFAAKFVLFCWGGEGGGEGAWLGGLKIGNPDDVFVMNYEKKKSDVLTLIYFLLYGQQFC